MQLQSCTHIVVKINQASATFCRLKSKNTTLKTGHCFRVEQIKGIYNIYQGSNLTVDMKNEIARYFDVNQIKYVFDDHETYSNDDKDVMQFVLNLSETAY